jgi:hypothetical protein
MHRFKTFQRTLSLTAAACLLCFTIAQAKKPDKPGGGGGGGGGGGPGQNGGGVIYFIYEGDLYTMNDDGSDPTPVSEFPEGYRTSGDPSYQLHGGKRWFLQDRGGQVIALSDSGDVVQLAVQQELEILGSPTWQKDDSLISFVGRRWETDQTSDAFGTIVEGGLYALEYSVDNDGNVFESDGSGLLVFPVELVPDSNGDPYPDMRNVDWAPDGLQFVFDRFSEARIEIGNILGDSWTLHYDPTDTSAHRASWSPAGDKIAFQRNPDIGHFRIMMINADGSGLKMLVRGSPNWSRTLPVWSPTGTHLLYHHWDHFYNDSYIIRVTADGAGKTRITDKSVGAGHSTPLAIGWRATN